MLKTVWSLGSLLREGFQEGLKSNSFRLGIKRLTAKKKDSEQWKIGGQ
jgi:hypothetical protein